MKRSGGFTLIELMLAVFLLGVLSVGLLQLFGTALRLNKDAVRDALAVSEMESYFELLRKNVSVRRLPPPLPPRYELRYPHPVSGKLETSVEAGCRDSLAADYSSADWVTCSGGSCLLEGKECAYFAFKVTVSNKRGSYTWIREFAP